MAGIAIERAQFYMCSSNDTERCKVAFAPLHRTQSFEGNNGKARKVKVVIS